MADLSQCRYFVSAPLRFASVTSLLLSSSPPLLSPPSLSPLLSSFLFSPSPLQPSPLLLSPFLYIPRSSPPLFSSPLLTVLDNLVLFTQSSYPELQTFSVFNKPLPGHHPISFIFLVPYFLLSSLAKSLDWAFSVRPWTTELSELLDTLHTVTQGMLVVLHKGDLYVYA